MCDTKDIVFKETKFKQPPLSELKPKHIQWHNSRALQWTAGTPVVCVSCEHTVLCQS